MYITIHISSSLCVYIYIYVCIHTYVCKYVRVLGVLSDRAFNDHFITIYETSSYCQISTISLYIRIRCDRVFTYIIFLTLNSSCFFKLFQLYTFYIKYEKVTVSYIPKYTQNNIARSNNISTSTSSHIHVHTCRYRNMRISKHTHM